MTFPRRSPREIPVSSLLVVLGVAAFYVLAARLGLALALQAPQVSAVWPPTGLAFFALLRYGRRAAVAIPGGVLRERHG